MYNIVALEVCWQRRGEERGSCIFLSIIAASHKALFSYTLLLKYNPYKVAPYLIWFY